LFVEQTFPHPRATRAAGKQMRRALLDAAAGLYADRGVADVSASEIARAAGAFPSQVTYYFGSKDALFVEMACRGILHAAVEVERVGARSRTPRTYVKRIVETVLASPALLHFVEAVLLARRDPRLASRVEETFARLHREGERAIVATLEQRGWSIRARPAAEARGFWAVILGVALESAVRGEALDDASASAAVDLVLNLYVDPDAGRKEPGRAA
jgi:AcrR family transcriptional regulator